MRSDSHFAALLWQSSGIEDFEKIGTHERYAGLLTKEKWNAIAHALAHLSFMNRLNSMLDSTVSADELGPIDEPDNPASLRAHRRYAKKHENDGAPRKANADELHAARHGADTGKSNVFSVF